MCVLGVVFFLLFILNTCLSNILLANAALNQFSASQRSSELKHTLPQIVDTRHPKASDCVKASSNILEMEGLAHMRKRRDGGFCSAMRAFLFHRCRGGTEASVSIRPPNETQRAHPVHREQHMYQRDFKGADLETYGFVRPSRHAPPGPFRSHDFRLAAGVQNLLTKRDASLQTALALKARLHDSEAARIAEPRGEAQGGAAVQRGRCWRRRRP